MLMRVVMELGLILRELDGGSLNFKRLPDFEGSLVSSRPEGN